MATKKLATVFSIGSFLSNLHSMTNVLTRFFLDFIRYSKQILIRYVICGYESPIPYPFKFIHHSVNLRFMRVSHLKTLSILYFLSWTIWCADPLLTSRCAAISFAVTRRFSFTMASTAAMPSGGTTGCAWPGPGESVTELMPFVNYLLHSYTCCSDRHASPYWTFIRRWIDGFHPFTLKNGWRNCSSLVQVCKRGRRVYTTTAPSCCIPTSYCHLSATLQTISIIVVNLETIEMRFEFLSQF